MWLLKTRNRDEISDHITLTLDTTELSEEEPKAEISVFPSPEQEGIQYVASSVIGGRKYQQDAYEVWEGEDEFLAVICDGMGGLNGGEKASKEAVSQFVEAYQNRMLDVALTDFLRETMEKIDLEIACLEDEKENRLGAGTTCVAAILLKDKLHWVSVGDSKLYIIRGEEMLCVTREHNYLLQLNGLLVNGKISEEEYETEVKKGAALISYLGMGNVHLMDINLNPLPMLPGDKLLLCSDGLYKALSDKEIFEIIKEKGKSLQDTVIKLQENAEKQSGTRQDNTTIILIEYHKGKEE